MRTINPETGKPYLRRKPLDFATARRIVLHRKAHNDLIADGFVEIREFAKWPFDTHSQRVIATAIHPDGSRVYVKTEGTAK